MSTVIHELKKSLYKAIDEDRQNTVETLVRAKIDNVSLIQGRIQGIDRAKSILEETLNNLFKRELND